MSCDHSASVKNLLARSRTAINEVSEEAERITDDISALIGDLVNVSGKDREGLAEWLNYFCAPIGFEVIDRTQYEVIKYDEDGEVEECE